MLRHAECCEEVANSAAGGNAALRFAARVLIIGDGDDVFGVVMRAFYSILLLS